MVKSYPSSFFPYFKTREQQLLDMDSLPHQSFYNSLTGNLTHAISRSSNKLYSVSGKDGYLENEL